MSHILSIIISLVVLGVFILLGVSAYNSIKASKLESKFWKIASKGVKRGSIEIIVKRD